MERPKLKIPLDPFDWILEALGFVFILLLIGFPAYYYSDLPDIVPRHFNAMGEPDGFSQKRIIWTLPGVGTVVYISMIILNRFPHIFNYIKEITVENAERQYRIATKLIRTINVIMVAGFTYIGFGTIQTALGYQEGLGSYFLLIFVLMTCAPIGIYLFSAFRK